MRWAGKGRGAWRVLAGKTEGKRPLERPWRRWEDNIKMDLQEIGCEGVEQIDLLQYMNKWRPVMNAVMNLLFSQNAGNFLNSGGNISNFLGPKYLPQHPILEHPRPMFICQCQRPNFTPIKKKQEIL